MTLKLKIRQFRKADAAQVVALNRDLAAFHGHKATITAKQFIQHAFHTKLAKCFVAEAGGKIIGFAVSYDRPHLGNGGRICMVDLLHTHKEFRRHGIGLALMRRMAAEAIKRDCHRLEVFANRGNKTSNVFYKKIDFYLLEHTSNKYALVGKCLSQFAHGKI